MSKYRKRWGTEEVAEYEDAVRDALLARRTDERTHRFIAIIRDAEQAHRPWAREVLDDMIYRGAANILRAEEKRQTHSTVEFKRDGKTVSAPRILGVRRATANGGMAYERALFDDMTVEELAVKRDEFRAGEKTYGEDADVIESLLDLCVQAGAFTPGEAVRQLGIPIEEWLSRKASAA